MYHAIDLFGVIDVVAKKEGLPVTRWIQVKATKANVPTKVYEELLSVPWLPSDLVEVWHWRRGAFSILQVHPPLLENTGKPSSKGGT